ncbi:serine carboxypeptidase II-2-like isoform X2 [Salvia splendens]|uniref:serine carboxypeptidase II-2-like isoform X2 n=1 Tax=Salvia splendens TaxID=180675 RepID=UPI001C257C7E|nr:serine carboxypeptidase II-2-like isoform X2 [Salvia splendens]
MPFWRWVFNVFVVTSVAELHSISCTASFSSDQQQLDRVLKLPGQNFDVSFAHYAGYITVNEESGRDLLYWFFEAEEDPSSKPIVLWLNGGPGCSSIAYGLAEEIGPLHIEKDGKTLYLNRYSWNKVANILFVDSPVGVGFSYSNSYSDLLSNGDKRTAADNLKFIEKWLERFPQFKGTDLYLTGESYAGHYVPQLAHAIVKYNEKNGEETINLKGFMVGNALTDDFHDHFGVFQFMWSVGMISDQTYKQLNAKCDFDSFVHTSEECVEVLVIADQEIGDIDMYSIYTPPCTANFSRLSHIWRSKTVGLLRRSYDPCTEMHSVQYFNLPEVQDALHVRSRNSRWETCSGLVNQNWQDSPQSVLDVYSELLNSGLRIWMFSGDTDAVIPVTSTRYNINAMKLQTVRPWRAWYDDGQVGGWTEEYEGLTFVTVRGAGHEVPLHKPKQALTLIKSFLSGKSMPEMELLSDS